MSDSKRFRWELDKRLIKSGGFVGFCNAFGPDVTGIKDFKMAPHHLLMAEKLERTITEPNYNVIICLPPGHAKSMYCSILFPCYFLGMFNNKEVVSASHTSEFATGWGRACRRIIETEKYQSIMGCSINSDSKSSSRFDLTNMSKYKAFGMMSGVTGSRSDLTLFDDPIKSSEEAESEVIREKIWQTYLQDFRTRGKPGCSKVMTITRRHEDDLVGRILNSSDASKWDVLILPAIANDNDALGRLPGEALWPDYITLDDLLSFRDSLDRKDIRLWNSLYQQNPTVESGYYFRKEWVKRINKLPNGLNYYGASDYAVTDGDGDYTVHMIIGHDPVKDDIYIVDVWRKQTLTDVWVDKFIDIALKYKPLMWAEESGQIIKSLDSVIEKEMRRRNCSVWRKQFVSATSKRARCRSFQSYMAAGRVYILNADWTDDLEREMLAFPDGSHDDQVDVLGLIGRMLYDMYMNQPVKKSDTVFNYKSGQIILPGISEKIGNKGKNQFIKI